MNIKVESTDHACELLDKSILEMNQYKMALAERILSPSRENLEHLNGLEIQTYLFYWILNGYSPN